MAVRKSIVKSLIIALSALSLAGCLATPYQPDGIGGGYSETQLGSSMIGVSFRANSSTPKHTVETYLLYRCAEVTRNAGYNYFVPLSHNASVVPSVAGPEASPLGTVKPDDSLAARANYFPDDTIAFTSDGFAQTSIKMFTAKPAKYANAYATEDVLRDIGPAVRGEGVSLSNSSRVPAMNTHVYSGQVVDYLADH